MLLKLIAVNLIQQAKGIKQRNQAKINSLVSLLTFVKGIKTAQV